MFEKERFSEQKIIGSGTFGYVQKALLDRKIPVALKVIKSENW